MNCSQCGVEVLPESLYCQKCGSRLDMSDADAPSDRTSAMDQLMPKGESRGGSTDSNPAGDLVWTGTFSAKAMIGVWIVLAIVTLILLVVATSFGNYWWTVFLIATPLLWLGGVAKLFYNQWSVRYTMTSKRFMHEHGLLRRVTDRIEVIDMDDVSVTQNLVERLTGTGTIRVVSSDRSHPEFYIRGVDDALDIGTKLDDARRAERERRGLHIESI